MSAAHSLRQWQGMLQALLGDVHAHQVKAVAAFSLAMALAQHCHLWRCALWLPGSAAKPISVQRRWERLLGNGRVRLHDWQAALARHVLGFWRDQRQCVKLLLDETPLGEDLRCLKLSAAYRGRAAPLMWCCYRSSRGLRASRASKRC